MSDMTDIKRMSVKKFRKLGYLQELNRRFLHPLGLALEVFIDDNGNEYFGQVWDYRDDPEGLCFDKSIISDPDIKKRANKISLEMDKRMQKRFYHLGYWIQPVDGS